MLKRISVITVILASLILTLSFIRSEKKFLDDSVYIKERVLLNILAGQSTSDPGIEEIFTEAIEDEFPEVEFIWELMDWGEQFDSQMLIRFASGEVPDIMIGKAQNVGSYASSGNLAEISEDLAESIPYGMLPSVSYEGKIFGLPYNAFYQGVLYNKDLFEQNGLEVPENMEDLEKLLVQLSDLGIVPFAAHFEEAWYTANIFMQFALGEIFNNRSLPGKPLDFDIFYKDNSADIEWCIDILNTVMKNSWDDVLKVNLFECDKRFSTSQAAMYVTGTWSLQNIEALNPELNLGLFPFPNRAGDARLIIEPNLTFMISALSRHRDMINRILSSIIHNDFLAYQICDYTKTATVLNTVGPYSPQHVFNDILSFEKRGDLIDATIGNSRLSWTNQEQFAKDLIKKFKSEN